MRRCLAASLVGWILASGTAAARPDFETFSLQYRVLVAVPVKSAGNLRLWLPIPKSGKFQRVEDMKIASQSPYSIKTESEYRNRYVYVELGRTVKQETEITFSCRILRQREDGALGSDKDSAGLRRFLDPDAMVPLSGALRRESELIAGKLVPSSRARALYDDVVSTMCYDKSGTGWGHGDALRACDVRSGNCTDFHSLFIGLSRVQKIPARFVMGLALPREREGVIPGYHCWAEFWDDGLGWVPVDASEAARHPDLRDFYFGHLDADRVEISVGRDILLDPRPKSGRLNYFVYPLVELDGRPYSGFSTTIHFQRG